MSSRHEENQLALSLTLPDAFEIKNYVAGPNRLALKRVEEIAKAQGDFGVYLWGAPGVGKTHLLQGACGKATFQGFSSIYLPLNSPNLKVDDLQGLEHCDLVCLDDIHLIAGKRDWEEALFHLYNRAKDHHKHFLVSGNCAPLQLPITLPDLRTRLGWGEIYHVLPLSDDDKLEALKVRAHQRGLHLADEVGRYLLNRASRSMPELYEILEKLDKASLAHQRALTIPFVKQILKI